MDQQAQSINCPNDYPFKPQIQTINYCSLFTNTKFYLINQYSISNAHNISITYLSFCFLSVLWNYKMQRGEKKVVWLQHNEKINKKQKNEKHELHHWNKTNNKFWWRGKNSMKLTLAILRGSRLQFSHHCWTKPRFSLSRLQNLERAH